MSDNNYINGPYLDSTRGKELFTTDHKEALKSFDKMEATHRKLTGSFSMKNDSPLEVVHKKSLREPLFPENQLWLFEKQA